MFDEIMNPPSPYTAYDVITDWTLTPKHQSAPDPANRFHVSVQRFYSKPAQLETQNIFIAK